MSLLFWECVCVCMYILKSRQLLWISVWELIKPILLFCLFFPVIFLSCSISSLLLVFCLWCGKIFLVIEFRLSMSFTLISDVKFETWFVYTWLISGFFTWLIWFLPQSLFHSFTPNSLLPISERYTLWLDYFVCLINLYC